MRHIRLDNLEVPDDWHEEAEKALADVVPLASATRTARNEEVERHATKTWRALKESLMNLSDDKCWYCEMKQDRSHGAVDHFRPKGKVDGSPTHPGYWWFAFDEKNYRYTCTFCNSATTDKKAGTVGGKRDQFPLLDEATRMTAPGGNVDAEEPMLLDPAVASDPGLLTWMVNGNPAPRYAISQNPVWNERATISIKVFHLHHYKLRRRRIAIYNELKLLVQEGDILYDKAVTNQPYEKKSMERVTSRVLTILAEDAELTATSWQYIREYRTGDPKREWLEGVIGAA